MVRAQTLFLIMLMPFAGLFAQPSEHKLTSKEYVELHKDEAVVEMLLFGVPASITLAQGILESDCGNSDLAVYANNHFGIKCHEDWTGPTYTKDDDQKDECFRKYTTAFESFSDHSQFLKSRARYAYLFSLPRTDYKGWAKGLKESGYATDPRYTSRLLEVIEKNKLMVFDTQEEWPTSLGFRKKEAVTAASVTLKPVEKNNRDKKINLAPVIGPRIILITRDRSYIIARDGDSFQKLTREFEKGTWELPKYNEVSPKTSIIAGQRVYLQPKHRRGNSEYHVVKEGESLYSISQDCCIRMKYLLRKNNLQPGAEPKEGDVLNLKRRKKS